MSTSPKRLAALASAALAVAGITVLAPTASQAAGTGLVISEVYGAGQRDRHQRGLRRALQPGAAPSTCGEPYRHTSRYVERRNLTGSADQPDGRYSLQYRACRPAPANAGTVTSLTGSIPANGFYTVTDLERRQRGRGAGC